MQKENKYIADVCAIILAQIIMPQLNIVMYWIILSPLQNCHSSKEYHVYTGKQLP